MKLCLVTKSQTRLSHVSQDRTPVQQFDVLESCLLSGGLFLAEERYRVFRGQDQVAIKTLKLACDRFLMHGLLNPIDGGRMACRGETGAGFAMDPLDFAVAIID